MKSLDSFQLDISSSHSVLHAELIVNGEKRLRDWAFDDDDQFGIALQAIFNGAHRETLALLQ